MKLCVFQKVKRVKIEECREPAAPSGQTFRLTAAIPLKAHWYKAGKALIMRFVVKLRFMVSPQWRYPANPLWT
jgi:hypothetical protein